MNNEDKISRDFGKEDPFKVPDDYFDALPANIQTYISNKSRRKNFMRFRPALSLHHNYKTLRTALISFAALAVLVIIFSLLPGRQADDNEMNTGSDSALNEAISSYLADNIDEETLIEEQQNTIQFFNEDEIPETTALFESPDSSLQKFKDRGFEIDSSITNENIIEYLLNENIDHETI